MNMSYCKFRNTLSDLRNCTSNTGMLELENDSSAEEIQAYKDLMLMCAEIANLHSNEIEAIKEGFWTKPETFNECEQCGDQIQSSAGELCDDCQDEEGNNRHAQPISRTGIYYEPSKTEAAR